MEIQSANDIMSVTAKEMDLRWRFVTKRVVEEALKVGKQERMKSSVLHDMLDTSAHVGWFLH